MKIISLVILVILSGNLSVFCQSEQFPNLEFTIQKTDIDGPISVINVHGDYYSGNCYQYKKREYLTGDLKMYDAITSKNIQMIKQLISEGYDLTIPIFTKDFSDVTTDLPDINFGFISRGLILKNMENDGSVDLTNIFYKIDNNGYTIASVKPTAAVKTTVLEYAKQINDDGIISLFKAEIENQLQAKRRQDSLRSANYTEKIKSGFNEIIPGKGFNSFEIGKTTLQEIINELGMNYKLEKDNFIKLYTYHYSELGVSFYFIGNKKTNKLYRIELTYPFKGVISKGIVLDQSNMSDVINLYGVSQSKKPSKHFMNKNSSSEVFWDLSSLYVCTYEGITFVSLKRSSHKPFNEKIIEIDIHN